MKVFKTQQNDFLKWYLNVFVISQRKYFIRIGRMHKFTVELIHELEGGRQYMLYHLIKLGKH